MNAIGWLYKALTAADAPAAAFKKIDFNFKAKHLLLKTTNSLEVSFDGVTTHLKIVAADGLRQVPDVWKGDFYYKGTGDAEVTAWDGN